MDVALAIYWMLLMDVALAIYWMLLMAIYWMLLMDVAPGDLLDVADGCCSGGRSRRRRLDRTPGLFEPGSWLGCAMGATREAEAN